MEDFPELSGWAQYNHRGPCKREAGEPVKEGEVMMETGGKEGEKEGGRERGRREEQKVGKRSGAGREREIEWKMLYAILLPLTRQAASRSWEKQEDRFSPRAFRRKTVPPTP